VNSITDRIDAVTSIPEEYRATVCPPPKAVKVELTSACDFKCYFCATGKNLRRKGHMDLALFKRIASDIRDKVSRHLNADIIREHMEHVAVAGQDKIDDVDNVIKELPKITDLTIGESERVGKILMENDPDNVPIGPVTRYKLSEAISFAAQNASSDRRGRDLQELAGRIITDPKVVQ